MNIKAIVLSCNKGMFTVIMLKHELVNRTGSLSKENFA